jgi:pimeloyl-ACP methyl ester carboxylesterase
MAPANRGARRKIIVFHGNAGHALHRVHFIEALQALDGGAEWEVAVFEYPGYGARGGETNEPSILAAGKAAFEALAAEDQRPTFILGESLGSGAACGLAGAMPERVAGVALVVPYGSLLEAASHHYPFLPVRLILRDRFDNFAALEKYRGPVVFVIAGEDEVVTAASGLRLHESYGGPKHLRLFPGLGHNELDYSESAPWWREITEFLIEPRGEK